MIHDHFRLSGGDADVCSSQVRAAYFTAYASVEFR
jgi:hypothetical protein